MARQPSVPAGLPKNLGLPETGVKPQWQNISATRLLNAARGSQDMKWAPWVKVVGAKKLTDNMGRSMVQFKTLTSKPNTPPSRTHICSIRYRNPNYKGPICKAPAIIVNCDCQRFIFFYEFALWYRGAAYLERCNGDYPVVTNPSLRLGVCKHLYHALTRLIQSGF